MPSITLSDLSWSTPDGRPLFEHLNLNFGAGLTGLVGRNGSGKSTLLKLIAGELRPTAGTVSVSGSIAMLRQQTEPAPGESIATLFGVTDALALLRVAERGEATMEQLEQCDWELESRLEAALARVGLDAPIDTLLEQLSGGQRARAAVARLLFDEPDFLLLDEPTNHLDREGRAAIAELLVGWRGGALVASHDRELLEQMKSIVELRADGAHGYGGGYSHWRERRDEEMAADELGLADAGKQMAQAKRVAVQNREKQARRDAAGRRKEAKGDMPAILIGARKNRAEATAGNLARVGDDRIAMAGAALDEARGRIEVLNPLTVAMPSGGLAPGRRVAELVNLSAGWRAPILQGLDLTIVGPERLAVTGPNGSGKSTLLALLAGQLTPSAGCASVFVDAVLLDQEVGLLDATHSIRDNFMRLNPGASENDCRASLARFMFRSSAALQQVATLSGGERLRAGLACVLGLKPPPLLLLDEPTNHLDLRSIEAVEQGLLGYDGALVVVSHDERFLDAIGVTRRLEL